MIHEPLGADRSGTIMGFAVRGKQVVGIHAHDVVARLERATQYSRAGCIQPAGLENAPDFAVHDVEKT